MISSQLDEITQAVKDEFGRLNEEQLNVRPAEDKWCVAQCLDHLIVYNKTYYRGFDLALSADYKPSWWQRINPLVGFVGKNGIKVLKSKKIRLNAPAMFRPMQDRIDDGIVARFAAHQEELKSYFDRMERADLYDVVVHSPAVQSVSVKTGDIMHIIVEHERRHLEQARRVKQDYIDKK